MIIVEVKGGLGNQLFQYAFGKCLAVVNNSELKLDLSFFENIRAGVTPRNFLLDRFSITGSVASKEESEKLRRNKFARTFFPYTAVFIKDSGQVFSERYFKKKKQRFLRGYWQSEEYFFPVKDEIRKEFTIKRMPESSQAKSIIDQIRASNSVSVHFRRTDYVGNDIGAVCSEKYYERAIDRMVALYEDIHLFVFSDDNAWVREHVSFKVPHTIVEGIADVADSVNDLYLMSLCKHNIIANSSFSWWGAWLNSNENKTVLSPDMWEKGRNIDTIIPASWTQISTF